MHFKDEYEAISFYLYKKPGAIRTVQLDKDYKSSNNSLEHRDIFAAIVLSLNNVLLLYKGKDSQIFKRYFLTLEKPSAKMLGLNYGVSERTIYNILRRMREDLKKELIRHDLLKPDSENS